MPAAASLRDLLRIRVTADNRDYIESINGNMGTALGFKKRTDQPVSDEPAIIIFVPRKIDQRWLPNSQVIRETLTGPDNLECPVDIVEGEDYSQTLLWSQNSGNQPDPANLRLTPWRRLRELTPLGESQLVLREALRGWTETITPGCQLAGINQDDRGYYGTLGCFATTRGTNLRGFITNQHVADHIGNTLWFPEPGARRIGQVAQMFERVLDQDHFDGVINEPDSFVRVDCAFAALHQDVADVDVDVRLPIVDAEGNIQPAQMGQPLVLDLDTMGPIGKRVLGIGRTRSQQTGTVVAFAYEYNDDRTQSVYTDWLISGDDEGGFSAPGDSGKLIVTEDGLRPVGLLWGGWQQRLRTSREQEKWSYGIDINQVMDLLDVDIER